MSTGAHTYDWLTLDDGEEILWDDTPALESRAGQFLGALPLIIIFGLGVFVMLYHYMILKNTEYVITTKAVYHKQGLYSRSVQKVPLNKIQDTGFAESTTGRMFGFGAVEISTAGSSGVELRLTGVEDPQRIQSLINDNIPTDDTAFGVDTPTETPAQTLDHDQLSAYLEEVKATRKSLETLRDNLN